MQRSIVCEASNIPYAHFRVNARKNIKPEFLLLDIVLIVKLLGRGGGGGGGGEVGGFGVGEASFPPAPPSR